MITPDVSDIKAHLIEDIIKKRRKASEVATVLGVSVRCINKWKFRYRYHGIEGLRRGKPGPKQGIAYNKTKEETEEVVSLYGMKYKKEGPARIKMKLDEIGVHMDQSTVYRILKRRNVRYHETYQKDKKTRKMYVLEIPGMEIQVDAWYPFGYHRKFVIYNAIDDCTRMVYSKAYEHANIESTKDFINELIRRYPFAIISIRTDQGREFSKTITKYLEDLHINHIKNEPYHPEHNGKIERYHLTEKNGEVEKRAYLTTIEEANYNLRQRISYYNNYRQHTGIGMNNLSPWAKYLETILKMGT